VPPLAALPVSGLPSKILSPTVPRNLICDNFGRQITLPVASRDMIMTQASSITTSSESTILSSVAADTYLDIIALMFSNTTTPAPGTPISVDIRDTTAGPIIMTVWLPGGDLRGISLPGVAIPQTNPGTNWTATASAPITTLKIWAMAVKNK
jgi:hypothetical protein